MGTRHPRIGVSTPEMPNDATDLLLRLRRAVLLVGSERAGELAGALARFAAFEHRRRLRKKRTGLDSKKDQIIARLVFLSELDEVTKHGVNPLLLNEMAAIFSEIGAYAIEAARMLRAPARAGETLH